MNRTRRVLNKSENNSSPARRRAAPEARGRLARACRRAGRAGVAASLAALMLAASFAGFAARAQTTTPSGEVGPINPDSGFPFWYEDANGLRLDLCLDNSPLCLTTLPDPTRTALVAADPANSNFPDEAFWWAGEAAFTGANGEDALLVMASEAAFAAEVPKAGDQMSFGRVRIRVSNLETGATYRVTHPYGVDIFENVEGGPRGINFTEDIGVNKFPNGFLDSRVKPFLTWDTFGVATVPDGDTAPPAGYIGDPTVDHKVKGSQIIDAAGKPQNYFRIEKIDPINRQVLEVVGETDLFSIQGKLGGLSIVPSKRGGNYGTPLSISLVASDPNALIFYTVDGTDPKDNISTTFYDGTPIGIAASTTLRYFAIDGLGNTTATATEMYVISPDGVVEPGGPEIRASKLKAPGPIDPNTGFPMWYEDTNGLRLDLCTGNADLCLGPLPDLSRPARVAADPADSNFPDEAFWWAADSSIEAANGVEGILVMAAEAAFAAELPKAGDQVNFGRVRVRLSGLEAGATYRVTHPYGSDVFENVAGGTRGVNYTEDIGVEDFPQGILNSRIGPFLTWDTFGVDPATIPAGDAAPPAGYVGDPAVEHRVKGSPLNQNFFRIEKLDPVTGEYALVAETDLFTVQGKLAELAVVPSLRSGTYAGTPPLSLVASDAAAKVYYTLTTDGTEPGDPTAAGRTEYTAPISLGSAAGLTTKVNFVAEITDAAGDVTRRTAVVSETYTSDNAAPTLSANPAGGTFDRAQSVSLLANEPAKIFYTTNGSDPSNAANVERVRFTQAIPVNQNITIKFVGYDLAGNASGVLTETYLIDDVPPPAPSTPDLDALSDDGASSTDNVTGDFTPTFVGTAEPGSTVRLFVDGVQTGSATAAADGSFSVTSSGLTAGTHAVTLRAVDAANNVSALSGSLSITISATAVPNAPSNLVATIQNVQNGQARLNWTDNSNNETSFQIARATSANGTFTVIATVGANTRTFLDTSVGRKVTVFYRVRAVNGSGSSNYSNTAQITTN